MRLSRVSSRAQMRWIGLLPSSLLLSMVVAQMPSNPTRVLRKDNLVYVFQPSSSTSNQFQLNAIDISSRVTAANIPYSTLFPSLPFLSADAPRAFTPILHDGGNITVYTGDCSQGASGGEVWTYSPAPQSMASGNWKQEDVSIQAGTHTAIMGANYLSGGISFSSTVGGNAATTGAYFFGGMCPLGGDNSNNWQSAANYSNLMVTLQPSSATEDKTAFKMDVSASRGPPVPEAGFSITGLEPTFSNRSDGSQTQQQNFLLIGGHTSAAFINMSQVALFSLPEQGWTFIGVEQPETSNTDLTSRASAAAIDPRSGHTAVLTPDGQRIIVFGGWVGDVDTPAEPQLAILNVASGYGGQGDWRWNVASAERGAGSPNISGLFGHGATMLPGGVMMITGGYSISAPTSRRRRATPNTNSESYFFNVTSNSWVTDYAPPPGSPSAEPIKSGPLSTPGQKAGLGVGLGIGLAAVFGLFASYMWYTRRLRKRREVREKQLQDLSFTTHRYNIDDFSPGLNGHGAQPDAIDFLAGQSGNYYFPSGTQGGQGWKQANGGDVERTGLLVEIPSPTRGLRRSLSGRPGYSMGKMRGPGQIHPIDELEEEQDDEQVHNDEINTKQAEMAERRHRRGGSILDNAPVLDPFIESRHPGGHLIAPHSRSSSPHHEIPGHSNQNPANWPLGAAGPSRLSHGRLSPDKSSSERTSSNLSDRSTRSGLSWASSSGGVVRSTSMRSAALLNHAANSNPFGTPNGSPTREHVDIADACDRSSPDPRTQSFTSIRSNGYGEMESFRTAQSSFTHLQVEGEALLGGNPERPRPGTSSSSSNTPRETERSNSRAATSTPATSVALDMATASRPATRERRKSWLGSVRRVLTRSASGTERTRSQTTTMSYHERYTDNPISPIEPSMAENRKSFPAASAPPRRAASDASFWRSRRGQQDWLEEENSTWKRAAGDDWGAPEDIVLAERERQRQEWRERGKLLMNMSTDDDQLPTPRTPIRSDQLGVPATDERPCTPASEADWDVEAAVERRVVQVMFTVPKSKLRVVNADPDRSSLMSLPREDSSEDIERDSGTSPSRVKDLAGRFEQMGSPPRMSLRTSPRPSPSPSIKSMKIRNKNSAASLGRQSARRASGQSPLGKGE